VRYFGVDDLCEMAGITLRQADHWTRKGWIVADNAGCGTGHWRQWGADEVEIARIMGRMTAAGVSANRAAAAARNDGRLAPGVRIVLEPV
jgi:hypothetical protein